MWHVNMLLKTHDYSPPVFMSPDSFKSIEIGDDVCVEYPSGNLYLYKNVYEIDDLKWKLWFDTRVTPTRFEMAVLEAGC